MSYYPKNADHKPLLFIHIPKAAGSSVREWYRLRYGKFHKCMHGSVSHPVLREVNKSMPSFTIVRNPYDLVYSWYRYKIKMLGETRHRDEKELRAWHKGFDYWLQYYFDKVNLTIDKQGTFNKISPSFTQLSYISANSEIAVDYVIQLENISAEWKTIQEVSASNIDLPVTNVSQLQGSYKTAYTSNSKRIVELSYKDDLNKWNYTF